MPEEKKSRYTKAQAASAKKYLSKFAEIRVRLQPEEKKIIEEKAAAVGKSVNQFIKDIVLNA